MNGIVDEIQLSAVHAQGGYMLKAYDLLKVSNSVADSLDINFNKTKKSDICTIPFNRLHVTCEGYLTACCVDYQKLFNNSRLKFSVHRRCMEVKSI